MLTLTEFASDDMLTALLIRERVKMRRKNRSDRSHALDRDCEMSALDARKTLSRIMPPRCSWVRLSKRSRLSNKILDTGRNVQKAILLTIRRDRKAQKEGARFPYLEELDSFMTGIRTRLASHELSFSRPVLTPILKSMETSYDGRVTVTCRPVVSYRNLEDKIIMALAARYLDAGFDCFLHENILSYRPKRTFHGRERYVTNMYDGIELIKAFRAEHQSQDIYASDCDVITYSDILPHQTIRDCLNRMLDCSQLDDKGREQIVKVINAFLESYNFKTDAWNYAAEHPEVYAKVRRKVHDENGDYDYCLESLKAVKDRKDIGIPQGGSLTLFIVNMVMNDVDSVFPENDPDMLFVRYCDDMMLLHTDYDRCCALMDAYSKALIDHGLYYHEFGTPKSHAPFLWDDDNRISYLGYEISRDRGCDVPDVRLSEFEMRFFESKLEYAWHSLRHYAQSHTPSESRAYCEKVLSTILGSVRLYKALDFRTFKSGSQYRHMKMLCKRMENRLERIG